MKYRKEHSNKASAQFYLQESTGHVDQCFSNTYTYICIYLPTGVPFKFDTLKYLSKYTL